MSDADWVAVTAIATWFLVLVTLYFELRREKRERSVASAQTILRLQSDFESPEFLGVRRDVSAALLQTRIVPLSPQLPDFFERVGMLTRGRILDLEMVWSTFSVPILHYYQALRWPRDRFQSWRTIVPRAFENFEWLYCAALSVQSEKAGVPPEKAFPPPKQVSAYLLSEVELAQLKRK